MAEPLPRFMVDWMTLILIEPLSDGAFAVNVSMRPSQPGATDQVSSTVVAQSEEGVFAAVISAVERRFGRQVVEGLARPGDN